MDLKGLTPRTRWTLIMSNLANLMKIVSILGHPLGTKIRIPIGTMSKNTMIKISFFRRNNLILTIWWMTRRASWVSHPLRIYCHKRKSTPIFISMMRLISIELDKTNFQWQMIMAPFQNSLVNWANQSLVKAITAMLTNANLIKKIFFVLTQRHHKRINFKLKNRMRAMAKTIMTNRAQQRKENRL